MALEKLNFNIDKERTAAHVLPNTKAVAESLKVAKKSCSNSAVKKVGKSNLLIKAKGNLTISGNGLIAGANRLLKFASKTLDSFDHETPKDRGALEKGFLTPFFSFKSFLQQHESSFLKGWFRELALNFTFVFVALSVHAAVVEKLNISKERNLLLKLVIYFKNDEVELFLKLAGQILAVVALMTSVSKVAGDAFFGIKLFTFIALSLMVADSAHNLLSEEKSQPADYSSFDAHKQENKRKQYIDDVRNRSLEYKKKILADRLKDRLEKEFAQKRLQRESRDLAEVIAKTNSEIQAENSALNDILQEAQFISDAEHAITLAAAKENNIRAAAEKNVVDAIEEHFATVSAEAKAIAKTTLTDFYEVSEKHGAQLTEELAVSMQKVGVNDMIAALEKRELALPTSTEKEAFSGTEYERVLSESFAIAKEREVLSKFLETFKAANQLRKDFHEALSKLPEEARKPSTDFLRQLFGLSAKDDNGVIASQELVKALAQPQVLTRPKLTDDPKPYGPETLLVTLARNQLRRYALWDWLRDINYIPRVKEALANPEYAPKIDLKFDQHSNFSQQL